MKTMDRVLLVGAGLLGSLYLLHAQIATSSPDGGGNLVQSAPPDSIVQLTAEAQGLNLVAPTDLPDGGTFWTLMPDGLTAPFPCAPNDPNVPVYQIADGQFIVDATGGQVTANPDDPSRSTTTAALETLAQTVVNLINDVQEAEFTQAVRAIFGMDEEEESSAPMSAPMMMLADTNALWLEITNVANGNSDYNLHNATNFVYAILTKTNLLDASWNIEAELWPTTNETSVLPFTLANYERDILFVRAMDWTGVDSNNDGVPDWWLWEYFGTLDLSATNLDGGGNTLLSDYTNNVVPHTFSFTGISVTNNYVCSSSVPVQLAVTGYPYYVAVLVDDTNLINAAWTNYSSSTVTVNLGLVEGWHEVRIGLRGYADAVTNAVWQWKWLKLDYTPPTLAITNPASGTVSVPMIQVQGFANEPLAGISYAISNASGIFTNQTGYLTGQGYDTNAQTFTTNYFQCYDIPLTNGLNTIVVHAVDLAGNATTTNFSFNLDYSGDHTAPALSVVWPLDGTSIVDTHFTLQSTVDDATATITAAIVDASGITNTVTALVQRDGKVWAQDLSLGTGANTLIITAKDAAGNASTNQLTVYQNNVLVTLNPLTQFNQASVTVRGTVSDTNVTLNVNGIAATINSDGTWEADGVPVSRSEAAILDVEVSSASQNRMAHASSGRMFQANDAASGTDGSKLVVVPQPPTVGVMSYNSYQYSAGASTGGGSGDDISPWNRDAADSIHWTFQDGGEDSGYAYDSGSPFPYHPSHDDVWDDILPAGMDAYNPNPWENADLTAQGGPTATRPTFTWSGVDKTQTRVMIEPQSLVAAGETNVYLVRAQAWQFDIPEDRYYSANAWYNQQLPADQLQIRGVTLTDSGDGWGVMTLSAPAAAMVEVTPMSQVSGYNFNVTVAELYPPAVDVNRDGQIAADGNDATSASNPYRFWVNNDYDSYDGSISDYADLDPSTGSDANNTSISCTRDLEDYTRLWINTQGLTTDLQNGNLFLALEWQSATDDPQMQFFQAAETNGGTLYLTDTNAAAQQKDSYGARIIEWAHHNVLTKYNPFIFPTSFWSNLSSDQPVAHLLFDAVSRGSGKLVVAIYKNDGVTKLAEGPALYLKLQDVKEMYERWTVGDSDGGTVASTANLSTRLPSGVSTPFQYSSSSPEENNYIFFVHGWNLEPWERDAFAETAFKRLYWEGYKGRFGAFQWPTGTGVTTFDASELVAWQSAEGLRKKLDDLNSFYSGNVYLMAHSMGNVVAGEALRLEGSNQRVNTYVAMQGAIASHAYDPNTPTRSLGMAGVYDDYTPNRYAQYPTNGGSCYFNGTAGAGTYVNFYNPVDYALVSGTFSWELNQNTKPDSLRGYGFIQDTGQFFKSIYSTELVFPHDRYEIFSACDEARCHALGAQADVQGQFSGNQINLQSIFDFGSQHKDHSGEFNSDNMNRSPFWRTILQRFDLTP